LFPSQYAEATDYTIRVSIPVRGKSSFLQNVSTGSGTHPSSYLVVTRNSCRRGCSGCSLKLTTHHYVVPKLRKSGSLLVLSLHFTVCGLYRISSFLTLKKPHSYQWQIVAN